MPWWPGGWWPAGLVALVAWLLVVALVACWPGGLVAKCYVFGFGFGGLVAHCRQATKPSNHKQKPKHEQRCFWWPWLPDINMLFGLVVWWHQAARPPSHQATRPPNHKKQQIQQQQQQQTSFVPPKKTWLFMLLFCLLV